MIVVLLPAVALVSVFHVTTLSFWKSNQNKRKSAHLAIPHQLFPQAMLTKLKSLPIESLQFLQGDFFH